MKLLNTLLAAGMAVTLLSGCAGAAFNRLNMTVHRNITVGQELMDLQAAHEKSIISDSEYAEAKQNVLKVLTTLGEIDMD
jgi:outer membrane murein-binding lipoprotein Lpp